MKNYFSFRLQLEFLLFKTFIRTFFNSGWAPGGKNVVTIIHAIFKGFVILAMLYSISKVKNEAEYHIYYEVNPGC